MKIVILCIIICTFSAGCAGRYDLIKKGAEGGYVIAVEKEQARQDGPLYILPADKYVIFRSENKSQNYYESVTAPLVIKEKEINPNSILFCLDKINDYAPLRNIITACNASNKVLIENIVSNMEKPVSQEFILSGTSDIEFYFSK